MLLTVGRYKNSLAVNLVNCRAVILNFDLV